jgi:hypothetical protein
MDAMKTILANQHLHTQQYAQLAQNETICYQNVIGLLSDSFSESENENESRSG